MAINGGCLCGAVRFRVNRFLGPFEICHCSRCRRVSGSMGVAAIGCDPADYQLLEGAEFIASFDAPILHQPPAYRVSFCRRCGSPVPPASPAGDFMEIPAGLLDDEPGMTPDRHIFTEQTPEWDPSTDNLPRLTREELIHFRRTNN